MKKKRETRKLALQAERIRELVLERLPLVVGGRDANTTSCGCDGAGGGGSTT